MRGARVTSVWCAGISGVPASRYMGAPARPAFNLGQPLWERPPCDLQKHERFFGLYRADGSLKPMGEVVRGFASSKPTVRRPDRPFALPISPDDFYTRIPSATCRTCTSDFSPASRFVVREYGGERWAGPGCCD